MRTTSIKTVFTPKQQQVLEQERNNKQWKLMINYGAVRAGKTFVDNFVFLYEVKHAAEIAKQQHISHPQYILAGTSSSTIADNVLIELTNTLGLTFKFDRYGHFNLQFPNLPAVQITTAYTGSIAGLRGIRGMTAFGAYINEASLANERVFEEIRSRCSATDARIVCNTNPDVPTHFLKVNYIDKVGTDPTIIANHFEFDDNTKLDPVYAKTYKQSTPSGMFYDRNIRGLWVAGDGLVYADSDKNKHAISDQEFHQRTDSKRLT